MAEEQKQCEHCKVGGEWMQQLHPADMVTDREFSKRIHLHMDCIAPFEAALPAGTAVYHIDETNANNR